MKILTPLLIAALALSIASPAITRESTRRPEGSAAERLGSVSFSVSCSPAALAWKEMQAARSPAAKTAREREYIAALGDFFQPDKHDYQSRIESYSAAMGKLYVHYPHDTDAGAFYALSLPAGEAPDNTSLTQERRAMAVLNPLFATYPDHPGVVHYIIHACDTPSLAPDGLAAARHYGEIAASGPHAVHMPAA
jgi:hypothetical protein